MFGIFRNIINGSAARSGRLTAADGDSEMVATNAKTLLEQLEKCVNQGGGGAGGGEI
jgi:hypothetical protein